MQYIGTIFWAHGRTLWHAHVSRGKNPARGAAWPAAVALVWYGMWTIAALALVRLLSSPADVPLLRAALPGALLLMFLYWQVVPLLLATTGSSLDLRRLRAYPVPEPHLFFIEILLRITSAIEMILLLAGMLLGSLLNPALPKWSALAALYLVFNLILAVGLRDSLMRMLSRKRVREMAVLLLVLSAILPQILLARRLVSSGPMRLLPVHNTWPGWPWTAAANLLAGTRLGTSLAVLSAWIVAACAFSSWQFARTLRFDADAARSGSSLPAVRAHRREPYISRLYRVPSWLLRDPLGALVEKELRSLLRSSRFRLVFLMGLIFGCLTPLLFVPGREPSSFFFNNYLTLVCIYALMLMSEVCFWNIFGFDRGAAQFYFLAPVSFTRVLIGKNLAALLVLLTQLVLIAAVVRLLGVNIGARNLLEAGSASAVVIILLFAAGNLLSIHQARGVNPGNSFRSGAAGRLQALLLAIYPLAFLPLALAYLARYAFASQAAFFAVLVFDAAAGLAFYKVSLESAVRAAGRIQETVIAALSAGDGPIAD